MLTFAGLALARWHTSGLLFFALICLRDVAAAYFLLVRLPDRSGQRFGKADILAYVSCGMPFLYSTPPVSPMMSLACDVLSILGFALATLALFELGTSFGVSPAARQKVSTGVYRWLRHPMYYGYIVAEAGPALLSSWNLAVSAASVGLYCWRAQCETRVLATAPSRGD